MAGRKVLQDLFISRIPFTAGRGDLREYFKKFGYVRKCEIQLNKKTGFPTGLGWVGFTTEDAITRVLSQKDHVVEGYKIQVQLHFERQTRSEEDDD